MILNWINTRLISENLPLNTIYFICSPLFLAGQIIVNRGDWLWNPNKDAKIYVGRSNPAQSFVLRSSTMLELRNLHVSIG